MFKSIHTPVNNLGYGLFGLGLLKNINMLAKQANKPFWTGNKLGGHPFDNLNIKHLKEIDPDRTYTPFFQDNTAGSLSIIPYDPNELAGINFTVFHAEHLTLHPSKNVKNWGFIHFETDKLSEIAVDKLKIFDKVFVTSTWAEEILIKHGISAGNIVSGIGIALPRLLENHNNEPNKDIVQFYEKAKKYLGRRMVLNVGKWEHRKGHPLLIRSFGELENSNLTLIGAWYNPFIPDGGIAEINQELINNGFSLAFTGSVLEKTLYIYKNTIGTTIVIFPRLDNYSEVLQLISNCDIFIAPTSGEGWNMPAVEALSFGKFSILPKNTAHLDYIDTNIPTHLDCNLALANDNRWFLGNSGNWYPVKKESLDESLRAIHFHSDMDLYTLGIEQRKILNKYLIKSEYLLNSIL